MYDQFVPRREDRNSSQVRAPLLKCRNREISRFLLWSLTALGDERARLVLGSAFKYFSSTGVELDGKFAVNVAVATKLALRAAITRSERYGHSR
jgi:hypothetical protein